MTPPGAFTARVASFGSPNANGTIWLPGSIADGTLVLLSGWAHWTVDRVAPPVGIGTLHPDGDQVILRGRFDFCMPGGRAAYHRVRTLGGRARWSIFASLEEFTEQGPIRRVSRAKVFEASPVLTGADKLTRTLSIDGIPLSN